MQVDSNAANAIRNAAARLGFSGCRIARAGKVPYASRFMSWIEGGGHAGMDWLAREPERRCDPRLVMPGCSSVIMLSYDYGNGWAGPLADHIARYAWGHDYHPIIEEKLADLDETLQFYGGRQRCYVDTGPVLERNFAELAGLGWTGRSGLIVRERGGSCFFLATILTTLPLPADRPGTFRCGSCHQCLDHCPTGALSSDGKVDAARCISYLTIEHKGSIPVELRPMLGARIYGCDECQKHCPWNRKPREAGDSRFWPSVKLRTMKLRDYLALKESQFLDLFRHSPVRRIKRERLLRNVCVALGNVGTGEDIESLMSAMGEGGLVAEHAQWAVEQIQARG